MLKSYKFLAILLLLLILPVQAQMSKTNVQNQILLNWPDNNNNAITASKLRIPNQIIVNSYLDLNGASSFQCPATQFMTGFTDLSHPSCAVLGATTGTGAFVLANSPTLVTPNLGTPSVLNLANATNLPIATGVSGLGTGVATALAVNVGSAGSPVVNGGALGTPSSGVGTNLTALNATNITSGTLPAARLPLTNASFSSCCNSVAGQTSASQLMTGAGVTNCRITPVYSGRVRVQFNIQSSNQGGADFGAVYGLRYADNSVTTAPAAGAALAGTNLDGNVTVTSKSGETRGFTFSGIATGLTVGHTYWFDMAQQSQGTVSLVMSYNCEGFEF